MNQTITIGLEKKLEAHRRRVNIQLSGHAASFMENVNVVKRTSNFMGTQIRELTSDHNDLKLQINTALPQLLSGVRRNNTILSTRHECSTFVVFDFEFNSAFRRAISN